MEEKIIKTAASVSGAVCGLLGGWDGLLSVLVTLMAADYITGLITAALRRSMKTESGGIDSKAGFRGICKKALMLLGVLTAAQLDSVMPMDGAICRDAIVCFFIANEGISIVENAALCGVPFPKALTDLLEQLKKKGGE